MNSLLILWASCLRLHFACLSLFKPNEDRNVLEESAGFGPKGEITEPEVRTRTCASTVVFPLTHPVTKNCKFMSLLNEYLN